MNFNRTLLIAAADVKAQDLSHEVYSLIRGVTMPIDVFCASPKVREICSSVLWTYRFDVNHLAIGGDRPDRVRPQDVLRHVADTIAIPDFIILIGSWNARDLNGLTDLVEKLSVDTLVRIPETRKRRRDKNGVTVGGYLPQQRVTWIDLTTDVPAVVIGRSGSRDEMVRIKLDSGEKIQVPPGSIRPF